MRNKFKPWYNIKYTVYVHWPEIPGKMDQHTTWCIDDFWTESIRKAKEFLKEHPDGKMTIVYG
jgi:hypothetical protein